MKTIKTALISVYDKTGLVSFARGLAELGVRIISTGQTAKALRAEGIACEEVSDVTGFPEMLDGRVKTLHPRIHAGVLARRAKREHVETLERHKIPMIDMVVVNLYPFLDAMRSGKRRDDVIEMIDIGGPTLLRAAAKNHESVASVCDAADYDAVLAEMRRNRGALGDERLKGLAAKVFQVTAGYDRNIAGFLSPDGDALAAAKVGELPPSFRLDFEKVRDLRYGENPHQRGALYRAQGEEGALPSAEVLGGKELSFNNYLDMESAWALVEGFSEPAACIVKHNSPCGAALNPDLGRAFRLAFACDPLSAFGGIVGLNRKLEGPAARVILKAGFLECIVAPDFAKDALEALKSKKNLRLVKTRGASAARRLDFKQIAGGLLVQDPDRYDPILGELRTVTRLKPRKSQMPDLLFAFKMCRFVKSNAIVLAKGLKTVGIGTGQPSRVDSAITAFRKAGKRSRGCVLASDGFFPKPDSIREAARHGVSAIIQPGGSIQDAAVIDACNRAKIAMVFTGVRHFTH